MRILARRHKSNSGTPNFRQRGLTLIETALALAVMALVVVALSNMMAESADQNRGKAVADKLTEVHEAAKGYIKANYSSLVSSGPAIRVISAGRTSVGAVAPVDSLQATGFLPSAFVNSNGYGQQHSLIIKRTPTNEIEAMVTTHGGREIPDRQLGRIANLVGAAGGYVPVTAQLPSDNGQVLGSYGGWRAPTTTWNTGGVQPTAGHIQATLAFENGTLLADYLYRNDIGKPEANRMNTNIDLNSNSLEKVNRIEGVAQAAAGSRPGVPQGVVIDGSVIATIDVWGTDVNASNSVTATNDVTAGRDLNANRNLRVTGAATIPTIAGNTNVTGTITAANANVTNDLKVTRNAKVDGQLDGASFNTSTILYNDPPGSGQTRDFNGKGLRLIDLLPRQVAQFSYTVLDNQVVPKPDCVGGYVNARVMLYRQNDSNRATPVVGLNVAKSGGFVSDVTQNLGSSYVDIFDSVIANDQGDRWLVTWDPSRPPVPGQPPVLLSYRLSANTDLRATLNRSVSVVKLPCPIVSRRFSAHTCRNNNRQFMAGEQNGIQ